MADVFDRQAAIVELVSRGLDQTAADGMTDGELVDHLRDVEANPGLKYVAQDPLVHTAEDAAALTRALDAAIRRTGPLESIDAPEANLVTSLATLTHGHMPDITPAQYRALAVTVIGDAIGAGVPLNVHAQLAILVSATLFPLVWVAADALIRYGRAKHIFGSK
jgi:hypothetical protein